ncbi:MAG: thioredoxin family protein [Planctomycetes bacterium]|nr:thioredoxin family protein [Planctomycetota bacterium]
MIPSIRFALSFTLALLCAATSLAAQESKVVAEVLDTGKAEPGKEWTLKLRFPIPEGFHAYHKDNPGVSQPIKVDFKELSGLKEVKQTWPEPKKHKYEYGEEWELSGNVDIAWTFAVPADAKGKLAIKAEWELQFCDEHGCHIAEGTIDTSVETGAAKAEAPKGPALTASAAFEGEAKPGGKAVLALTFEVSKGFSAYHKDNPGISKPLAIKFTDLGGLKLESETWPEPKKVKEEWADAEEWKLSGKFTIRYTFTVPADARGELKVAGTFDGQICDDDGCHDRSGTFAATAKVGTIADEKKNDAKDAHGFYLDYDFALAESRRLNKPLLIDFNGKFCVPCRRMEKEVFTLPEVHKLLEGFVVVSIITDVKDAKANQLFSRFQSEPGQSIPLYVVVDHSEKAVRSIGSTLPGSTHGLQFAAFLKGEPIPEVAGGGQKPEPAPKVEPSKAPSGWPAGLAAPKPDDLKDVFDFESVFTAGKVTPGGEVTLELRFKLKTGPGGAYHLYHPQSPHAKELGATLMLLESVDLGGLSSAGPWEFPKPFVLAANDPKNQFKVDEWQFHDDFRIVRRFKLPANAAEGATFRVTGTLAGQYCDEGSCTWFTDMDQTPFGWLATVTASASGEAGAIAAATMTARSHAGAKPPTVGPVDSTTGFTSEVEAKGLFWFLLGIFGLGMVTLLTPCVLPVLPLTVAFFVKQSEQGRSPLVAAGIYCTCIVVVFTMFGLITSLALGEQGAQIISTNAWVNIAIGVLFFVFALSFFGMFELRMPTFISSWISRKQMNAQQQGKGYATALLSGGSFAVISFSCTGPIAATLLAGVATGFGGGEGSSMWIPTLAMLVFALGLAAPIFVLGQFPNLLKRLPKSGGWMNALKVVFAFIEVAIAIRYFSWAEIAFTEETIPTWISRDLVDAVWIACSIGAGLYLLGTFRMPHDHEKVEQIGVVRMLFAVAFLAFGAYLIPGLVNGKPMGLLDGFLPPREYHAGVGGEGGGSAAHALKWHQNLPDGLAEARATGKPVFIDFTGKICANCRWVETNIMPKPEVLPMLQKDFVLVQQWTDVKSDQAAKDTYKKYGVGSKGVPMYVIVDADGNLIEKFVPPQFINTLTAGEFAAFMSRAKGKLQPTG